MIYQIIHTYLLYLLEQFIQNWDQALAGVA